MAEQSGHRLLQQTPLLDGHQETNHRVGDTLWRIPKASVEVCAWLVFCLHYCVQARLYLHCVFFTLGLLQGGGLHFWSVLLKTLQLCLASGSLYFTNDVYFLPLLVVCCKMCYLTCRKLVTFTVFSVFISTYF